MTKCRGKEKGGTCERPVVWADCVQSGRKIPLVRQPKVYVMDDPDAKEPRCAPQQPGKAFYTDHSVECPDRQLLRKDRFPS